MSPLPVLATTSDDQGGRATAPDGEVVAFAPLLAIDLPRLGEYELPEFSDSRQVGLGRVVSGSEAGDIAGKLVWLTAPSGDLVATLQITSPDAKALRVALRAVLPGDASVRFVAPTGEGQAHVASRRYGRDDFAAGSPRELAGGGGVGGEVDPRTVWSPIIPGETVGVEVALSRGTPVAELALEVAGISHFPALSVDGRTVAQRQAACTTVDVQCSRAPECARDAALRITFTDPGGNSYACSATAVNDNRPLEQKLAAPSVLTSHRCFSTAFSPETITANWNQRTTGCGTGTLTSSFRELSGGAELLASHVESDHVLLRLRDPIPTETDHCLAGWSVAEDVLATTAFAVHHGASGLKEWAEGEITENTEFTFDGFQVVTGYKIDIADGVLADGSAGAGWFMEKDGERKYVGVQSKAPVESCGVASVGSFRRFFNAVGSPHLGEVPVPDDHGDSARDATLVDLGTSGAGASEGTIGAGGDVDVFQVDIATPGILTAYTRGDLDTVGELLNEAGEEIADDDDGGAGGNFRLVADVAAGTYLVRVRAFEETTGDYTLVVAFVPHLLPPSLTYSVPLFLPVGEAGREGFLRVINNSSVTGTVDITAIDDLGRSRGPVVLTLDGNETVHVNSGDLERGSAAKACRQELATAMVTGACGSSRGCT